MKKILYLWSSAALLTACDSRTYEEISVNTPITVPVRYNTEVKTIVDNNCISCHGAGSFKPLATYSDVKDNIEGILDRIQRPNGDLQKMPKGGSLSQTQINTFIKWKADGLTEN